MITQGSLIQYPTRRQRRCTQRLLDHQQEHHHQQQHHQQQDMIYSQALVPWWFDHRLSTSWGHRSGVQRPVMTIEEYRMRSANSRVYQVVEPNMWNLLPEVNVPRMLPRRRSVHTLSRLGEPDRITQPMFYLALDELQELRQLHGQWDAIASTSQFVAEYLAKNMTIGLFHAGNGPRYGPAPHFPDAFAEDPNDPMIP
ncbi:uncharacterized protein LOC108137086 [Drosophila elegans]|uniref:uncharacterized protein LOC108137086 n=1 Tax=Drosophila elegans TaxID=30023 RepID=UPI0007E7045C|nr:uncharacterized protein LOC108137086 [Drosophila elegans]